MERPRSGTERAPCCRRAHRPQRADHATSRIGHETAPNRLSRLLPHRGFHLGAEGLSARNRRFESMQTSVLTQRGVTGRRLSLARMTSANLVQDEGFGTGIVLGEISIDGGLQVDDRAEYTTADALPRHLGKVRNCAEL